MLSEKKSDIKVYAVCFYYYTIETQVSIWLVGWGKRTLTGKGNAGIFQGQCYTD
jgi:hypothetical protein